MLRYLSARSRWVCDGTALQMSRRCFSGSGVFFNTIRAYRGMRAARLSRLGVGELLIWDAANLLHGFRCTNVRYPHVDEVLDMLVVMVWFTVILRYRVRWWCVL